MGCYCLSYPLPQFGPGLANAAELLQKICPKVDSRDFPQPWCSAIGHDNLIDAYLAVMLTMAFIASVVFTAAEFLDVVLLRGMVHDFADNLGSRHIRLADLQTCIGLYQQDPFKHDLLALFDGAIIHNDVITFAHTILSGPIFKDRVHACSP